MAIETRNLSRLNDGAFSLDYSYDNVSFLLTAISAVNNDVQPYTINAMSTVNGNTYETVLEVNSSVDQIIPEDVITGFQLSITTGGKLDGIEWHIS